MERVDLVTLIRDWHDREKHPLVSITRADNVDLNINGFTFATGHIWVHDFDVANIFDREVRFAGWKNADGPNAPFSRLDAADPEFFDKLDKMLTHLATILREI